MIRVFTHEDVEKEAKEINYFKEGVNCITFNSQVLERLTSECSYR